MDLTPGVKSLLSSLSERLWSFSADVTHLRHFCKTRLTRLVFALAGTTCVSANLANRHVDGPATTGAVCSHTYFMFYYVFVHICVFINCFSF